MRLRSLFGVERPILRVQLAILYSGFFLGLLVVVLGAAGLLILRGSQSRAGAGLPRGATPPSYSVLLVLGIGLVAAIIAIAGAWWLAGRFLRPLRAMTQAAEEISATNLHRRLLLAGPDDELHSSAARSTACSRGSRRHSRRSAGSWPTRHTSCARLWLVSGRCCR